MSSGYARYTPNISPLVSSSMQNSLPIPVPADNLGDLHGDQGKLTEAELFQHALQGEDNSPVPVHTPDISKKDLRKQEMYRHQVMITDSVLSLDIGLHDSLYRIRRDSNGASRVIYVKVANLDIIPEERRTYGPLILRELSALKGWNNTWDTLTVFRDKERIQCYFDTFCPHKLQEEQLPGDYERINVLNINVLESIKDRVFRVVSQCGQCILKIARFSHELTWLAQEITVYHILTTTKPSLAPRLLGYAFEERGQRVIGFLFQEVIGRVPRLEDLEVCERGLQQLHDLDIIHGDINKHNIFITDNGAKFIDFEDSQVGPTVKDDLKDEEMRSLKGKLLDESGKGQPWIINEN